jgi:hypothetical protein
MKTLGGGEILSVAGKVYKNAIGITLCQYSVSEDTGYRAGCRFDVIITIYPAAK